MTASIKIKWEGHVPGLAEHTLSLEHWLKTLGLLLVAVKRTASQMMSDAVDDSEYGSRGGQLKDAARSIDLFLTGIEGGSTTAEFHCVSPTSTQRDLFGDLPARALDQVLENIEREARGELRSVAARRYLESVPDGVTKQTYTLKANGHTRMVVVQDPKLAELPAVLPLLRNIVGEISSIGVAKASITIKEIEGRSLVFDATEEQIESAFKLRKDPVGIICTVGTPQRIIAIRAASADAPSPQSDADRTDRFLSRWSKTLEILGR